MLTFVAIMVRMFGHNLDARFGALAATMASGFEQIDKRFEQVERRLDRIDSRVDALDRDVTAITRRLMDGPDTA